MMPRPISSVNPSPVLREARGEIPEPTLPHISGKNNLGRFAVRRKTIRKRIRAKLRRIKPELRKRMHDPLTQTGQWLKSIVRGYFNYYAVPGNTASLSLFRHRLLVLWWHIAVGARSAGSPGHECLTWPRAGYRNRKCSIPILMLVSPLLI